MLGQDAPPPPDGMRVVVCGSASPLGNDPTRAQACIAVLTPEHFFPFDVGARSPLRINQAQLPLRRLNGVFLTHFHSDHIASLPDVNLTSWVQGRGDELHVYGPHRGRNGRRRHEPGLQPGPRLPDRPPWQRDAAAGDGERCEAVTVGDGRHRLAGRSAHRHRLYGRARPDRAGGGLSGRLPRPLRGDLR